MTSTAFEPDIDEDDVTLLEWLRHQADQNVPEAFKVASIPVAWLGRTSTDDAQDPTLSLPRQLDTTRKALPPGFVIVAKFYDVESGRNTIENRGKSNAHEHLNIPIDRDGGVADLLAEAKRPDRRFVAVVCESIERVARVTYFSTKIEFELEKAGVALLAADEGIDSKSIPSLNQSDAPYRRATPTLTRRIKQAIAEWYVLNMLELTWGGLKAHTAQGYNIGKPPYGYLAERVKHPVKAKAREGKTKHRLIPDPVRGPVVVQIFLWRSVERIGYDEIACRLNLDPQRYPPPDPILGEGRRRVGAWVGGSVRDVLENPKHTGYMVWNRRKRGHKARDVRGRNNPPSAWVWSPRPTHEPLVTRELFSAASTVGRFRQGSRATAGASRKTPAVRTYALRSYVVCDLCDHRYYGCITKGHTYYRCTPNAKHHGHLPWFAEHPRAAMVREDLLTEPLAKFLRQRVFGVNRKDMISVAEYDEDLQRSLATRRQTLTAEVHDLQRRQDNLIKELELFEPSGNADVDTALRSGIRARFASVITEQKAQRAELDQIAQDAESAAPLDLSIFDQLPQAAVKLHELPEVGLRRLYDALHLELRYHPNRRDLVIRASISSETLPAIAATIEEILYDSYTPNPFAALDSEAADQSVRDVRHDSARGVPVRDVLRAPGGAHLIKALTSANRLDRSLFMPIVVVGVLVVCSGAVGHNRGLADRVGQDRTAAVDARSNRVASRMRSLPRSSTGGTDAAGTPREVLWSWRLWNLFPGGPRGRNSRTLRPNIHDTYHFRYTGTL